MYHPLMKQAQDDFDKAVKRAKSESWHNFTSKQSRETVWSQVYRLCRGNTSPTPSTIRLPDDTFTDDAQSTTDYLLDRFLPDDDQSTDERAFG